MQPQVTFIKGKGSRRYWQKDKHWLQNDKQELGEDRQQVTKGEGIHSCESHISPDIFPLMMNIIISLNNAGKISLII